MGKTVKDRLDNPAPKPQSVEIEMPPEERVRFARNFKAARKALKLRLTDIEAMTGVSDSFISDVETLKSTISIDKMALLAKAVNQTVAQLISQ